jgi:Tfp pilus assembly protein PilX
MKIPVRHRREGGAALLVAMLMLALMGLIGFASMDTVMRDRQVAGNQSLSQTALYAADAGIAAALDLLRTEIVTATLAPGDCLTGVLPASTALPNAPGTTYGPDSVAGNQICMLASAEPCAELDASIEQGQPIFLYTVWNIQTEGRARGGARARVQATAARCHSFNN